MRTLSNNLMSCLERHRSVLIEIRQQKEKEKQLKHQKEEERLSDYVCRSCNHIIYNFDNEIEDVDTPECGYFKNIFRIDSQVCKTDYDKNVQLLGDMMCQLQSYYSNIPGIQFTSEIIGHTLESKILILV